MSRARLLVFDQYGSLGGGQTVALQLLDLFAPGLPGLLVVPAGPWSGAVDRRDICLASLSPLRLISEALRIARRSEPHALIVINGPRAAPLALFTALFCRSRMRIYYLHTVPSRRWMRLLTWVFALACPQRIAVAGCLARLMPGSVRVLHNCARPALRMKWPEIEHIPRTNGEVVFKFLGRADAIKGLDVLLEALSVLSVDVSSGWRCELAVSEGLERSSPALSVLPANCVLVGERTAEWLVPGDVLVLPSRFEASSLVIHEAMARGVAVVASAVGGTVEILSNNSGFLFESENASDLARQMGKVVSEREDTVERVEKAFILEAKMIRSWEAYWDHVRGQVNALA